MEQNCWQIQEETGFLMTPDPIYDFATVTMPLSSDVIDHIQTTAVNIPKLIRDHHLRQTLLTLPIFDMTPLMTVVDFRIVERLFQIYAHFAQAFIWCENDDPMSYLPPSIAVPFVQLATLVERPPIVPYATTALSNYQRIDHDGEIEVDNLRVVQKMIDIPDESWFHLIHVEIEAKAGRGIHQARLATRAVANGEETAVENSLSQIADTFDQMIATFKRMPEGCSPDVYYHTLRPYLFGFENIEYQGVEAFGGEPQSFLGETGAQSSVIPAFKTFFGLAHAHGGLTDYLELMKQFMPKPHRQFLATIDPTLIRSFVQTQNRRALTEAYNLCLEKMVEFRTLHLHFAQAYIASKVKDPRGTGGTDFMRWLKQLRDETAVQLL